MRHFGVQVKTEDEEQDAGDKEGTAADKLKEVDAATWRAHHDGLNEDERDESQNLQHRGEKWPFNHKTIRVCSSGKHIALFYQAENQNQHFILTTQEMK